MLSEIWQTTSTPDWQRVRAASLTSDGPFDRHAHQLEAPHFERSLELLPGDDRVDFAGNEKSADPPRLGQDLADRSGPSARRERRVGPGHVRPVVRVRLPRPGGDRVEHAREDDRLTVDLPYARPARPAWRS